jgi:uncharacterized protein (DUF952 family)
MIVHEILHITTRDTWEQAKQAGLYRGDTLESEGFIHCSTVAQVIGVANARFRGRTDLILLVIDPSKLAAEVRWEASEHDEVFPHIYGPLNVAAVFKVFTLEPGADGRFAFPTHVAEVQRDGRFVREEGHP